jgi:predicted permease
MALKLFSIISPILICAAIGFVWARLGRPFDTRFVTRLIMSVGAPFLIVSSIGSVEVEREAMARLGLAVVCLLAVVAAVGSLLLRALRMEIRSYLGALLFPNTGNMGLPLCLFAFGHEGLSLALVVFVIISITHFTAGVALVSGESHPLKLLGNPIVWAAAIGTAILLAGWKLPEWAGNTVTIMAGLAIPLMLLTLGVSLAKLRVRRFSRSLFLALVRMGLGFVAAFAVAHAFGLAGMARGVLILDGAMPVAVFNYLLAERYQRAPDEIAGAVVISTILSFVTLPVLLWYLLSG